MKNKIRLSEAQLHRIVCNVLKETLNEMPQVPTAGLKGQNVIEKLQTLVDEANNAYQSLASEYGTYCLIDRDGSPYGLKGTIKLNMNGFLIIPFESGTEKIKVFTKSGGRIKPYNDWMYEGMNDAKKYLRKIIKDAQRGKMHMETYDPDSDL